MTNIDSREEELIIVIEEDFERFKDIPELNRKAGSVGEEENRIGYGIQRYSDSFEVSIYSDVGETSAFNGTIEGILIRLRAVFLSK